MTDHFTLRELTRSDYAVRNGLGNIPSLEAFNALHSLCVHTLEPLRALLGVPLLISSAYRSRAVNRGIGGAKRSQHIYGEAADFEAPPFSNIDIVRNIVQSGIPFDQLIDEFPPHGWVHISYTDRYPLRREVLTAYKDGKLTKYAILEV